MTDVQDNLRFLDEWEKENIESTKGKTDEQICEISFQQQAIDDLRECVYQCRPNTDIIDILFNYMIDCLRVTKETENGYILYIYRVKYGTAEKIMDSI